MSKLNALFRLTTVPRAAVALMALGAMGAASAQTGDLVRGRTLFDLRVNAPGGLRNCEDCHGSAAVLYALYSGLGYNETTTYTLISNAINSVGAMAAYRPIWGTQERLDVAAYIMRGPHVTPPPPAPTPTPTPSPSPVPATPAANPNPVIFNATAVGSNSSVVGVLLTNSAAATVTFASIPVTLFSGNANDFVFGTPPAGMSACAANLSLAPGMSCSFGVRFNPQAGGSRFAVWNVNFTGGVVARQLNLQGTATVAPTPSPSPSPAPAPSASASAKEAGGATGFATLAGLLAALLVAQGRRRHTDKK